MKKYMIISDTMKQSDYWYIHIINELWLMKPKYTRTPIRTIEVGDVCLYFTNYSAWLHNYRYSRNDAEVLYDTRLEKLFEEWTRDKRRNRHGQ